MRLFNAAMVDRFMQTARMEDEVPIESKMVTRSIASAQSQVEARNYEIRKNVLKYDDVLNRQRQVIYAERRSVLEGADMQEQVRHFVNDVIAAYVANATAEGYAEEWDLDQLWTALKVLYPVSITVDDVAERAGSRQGITAEVLREELTNDAHHAYDRREAQLGEDAMREFERRVVMAVLDRKWREHLYEMDYLQEGIGLRAMAQRDPLVEYQREGYNLFEAMMDSIKEESVAYLFNVEVEVAEPTPAPTVAPVPVGQLLQGLADAAAPQDALAAPPIDAAARASSSVSDAVEQEPEGAEDGHGSAFRKPVIHAKGLEGPSGGRLHYSAPGEAGGTEERDVVAPGSSGATPARGGQPTPRRSSKKARRRGK